jgi:hypothetical protein
VSFAQPSAGGEKFEPKDFGGALLLIYPKSYNPNETTTFGPSTSADVDVVVVDRPDATGQPTVKRNARLFGNLANSVRDSIGGTVLGRLGQVPTNKGNPAWVLQNYTDADVATATPVDAAWKAGQFQQQVQQPRTPTPPQGGDLWAGQQQYQPQPPAVATTPTNVAPPAAPAPPSATGAGNPNVVAYTAAPSAATGDPNVALLIGKGLDPAQVVAMDPATRAAVAATYQ